MATPSPLPCRQQILDPPLMPVQLASEFGMSESTALI